MADKFDRLPKWAQDHIRNLQREKDTAVKALIEYTDEQTKSQFYYDDILCIGENGEKATSFKRRYIQTRMIQIDNGKAEFAIYLKTEEDCIDVYLNNGSMTINPVSSNLIRLGRKNG